MKQNENFDELTKRSEGKKWYVVHAAEIAIIFWVCFMGALLMLAG
jgi:hypothetical protein